MAKQKVNRFSLFYRNPIITARDNEKALGVIENWNFLSHTFPRLCGTHESRTLSISDQHHFFFFFFILGLFMLEH